MKKSFRYMLGAALMLAAACSCSLNDIFPSENGSKVNATIEQMTRTQLAKEGDIYKVNWVAGDRIAVTNAVSTAYYTADSGGSPVSSFSPAGSAISGGPYTAWYPASLAEGILPSIQQYKADGTVETPMRADSGTLDFNFRNLCGVIRLNVSTALQGVRLDRVVLEADQGMSGSFQCIGSEAVVNSSDGVRLDCGGIALGAEPVSLYISVPANEYTGLAITLYTSDGLSQRASLKEGAVYKVGRSQVCEISFVANDFAVNHYDSAILVMGNEVNNIFKKLAGDKNDRVGDADSTIRKIVFDTGSKVSNGTRADSYDSPYPIYVNWDKKNATITVSTPAASIRTGAICGHMFAYLYTLEEIVNLGVLDTSEADDMNKMFMFAGCRVANPRYDVSHFNTSKVRIFYRMFYYCETLEELDVSGWDGSSAVNLDNMFRNCVKLKSLDLASFNTPNATTFRSLFNRCDSIEELDLDNMETGKGELMTYVFYGMKSLRKLSIRKFDVNRPDASITYMFSRCPNLAEIHLGDGFLQNNTMPSNFFLAQSEGNGTRTASLSKKLTIYCNQATANWLAKTNLRWIHSGYSGKTPIEVVFIDNATGATLTPAAWGAN